ncbi:MAG: hypothetical protein HY758_10430 [Nitrospirae bacterium]|nr:hypothetical protein [Nitrospirota bacterium]
MSGRYKKIILHFVFYVLFFYCLTGCVPKAIAPPPLYRDKELSLEEVIAIARGKIHSLKAIVAVDLEKNEISYPYVDASLLITTPKLLRVRLYKFGLQVGDYVIKDDLVHVVSGKMDDKLSKFGKEFYYSIFWWEGLENAVMYSQGTNYVIRTDGKEILVDSSTLLPERQEITAGDEKISIFYERPEQTIIPSSAGRAQTDLWYPSLMKILTGTKKLNIKIEKLSVNPQIEESDFTWQEEGM